MQEYKNSYFLYKSIMIQLPVWWTYIPNFVLDADLLMTQLTEQCERKSYPITMFGKTMMQPRLVSYYADPWVSYTYAQTSLHGSWRLSALDKLKESINIQHHSSLNSVLCNLYRDGSDSMWRHADNETQLGSDPHIYSITLWHPRKFSIKSKDNSQSISLILEHWSLLIMWPQSQTQRLHALPKTTKDCWPRINCTFRTIMSHS